MTDDEIFDAADKIEAVLSDTPMTPSAIGRKVKMTTGAVGRVLAWMVRENYVIAVGNGGWTKYRARRFGETNRAR